jgi:hypothetical protein
VIRVEGKKLLETEPGELYENKSKCRRDQLHQKQEQKTFNPHNQERRKV